MQKPAKYSTGKWYNIQNRAPDITQVMIYGEIGQFGISADSFVNDLRQLKGDLDIHLNTAGGSVFDGVTIHNVLKAHNGHKTVIVDGLAASIGSVIAMAGDEVYMAPGSQMMIHEGFSAEQGDAQAMRKMADVLDRTSQEIAGFYSRKTGTPAEQWRDLMRQETWFNAQEAVDAGLADAVIDVTSPKNLAKKPEGCCSACGPDCKCMEKQNHTEPVINVSKPHGVVPYADPGYLDADGEQASKSGKEGVARYPIDAEHVKAAWSYINQEDNASQYTAEQLAAIKSKIKKAMKEHGHEVADNSIFIKIQSTLNEVFV